MPHARQQIRYAAATQVNGLTTTADRVYRSRVYPIEPENLPCLAIYAQEETREDDQAGGEITEDRLLTLVVEGRAQANELLDDTLDTIAEEVEVVIASDRTLGGKVKYIYLESTEIEISVEGEHPTGLIKLNYMVEYRTDNNAPSVILD